ncbi:hypothetical protein FLONG3_10993 [Fusarium longipes]|uniref:Thioredoxin 1 n=1 Tax=Fusarium longipes TaxID=694270 RepID=A0A395RJ68_9HYPO|nr:hypothetical protein FLONG3_10993 [Fusarium longipes]
MSEHLVVISSKSEFDSLLRSSRIVVADFYADWCGPCKQIAPIYEALASKLSRPKLVTFAKINSDEQTDLSREYNVSALPTFLIFRDRKEIDKVQGADPHKLKAIVQKLVAEVDLLGDDSGPGATTPTATTTATGSGSGSSDVGKWKGAEAPRGYSDITDQIELRDLEVLNADEAAGGGVRVLFDDSKPSGLRNGKGTSKDYVQSGADDQMLLYVPFQSILTSLPPKDDEDVMRPGNIHLYINRTHNLDFGEADDTEPTQAIEIGPEDWNSDGTVNLSLRYVKFQKTSSLVIYVQRGEGDGETVRLDRVRLIGEAGAKREMGKLQKVGEDD